MLWMIPFALANPLEDYGDQKHTDRPKVTKDTCEQAFIERCRDRCDGDTECAKSCRARADEACKKRQRRQAAKTAETVVKGASVGAGAATVIVHNAVRKKMAGEGSAEVFDAEENPYAIRFFSTTVDTQLGGGVLLGGVGAGTANLGVRWAWFGAAGGATFLASGGTTLLESDFGPTFSIASPVFLFTAQPSVLVSRYDPDEPPDDPTFRNTLIGGGLRSYTTAMLGKFMFHFDPMLGLTNGQWNYHLRVGASYRFHPRVYARLNYDYRDIVDLTDLDISSASLQGVVLQIGFRVN
jgi:hypothetical protein